MKLDSREDVIDGYAILVLRNEDLKNAAKNPYDVGYHSGMADCARTCMLALFYDKWGTQHNEKWLWAQVKEAVEKVRPRYERDKAKAAKNRGNL